MNNAVAGATPLTSITADKQSRTRALALALAGLLGMFLTLLGWTGHVRKLDTTWGVSPVVWIVIGAVIVLGAAIADAVLGARADFVGPSATPSGSATFLNRLLPWVIVAMTAIGMVVVSVVHG